MAMLGVTFRSAGGPIHDFRAVLPTDCQILRVIMIGDNPNVTIYFELEVENESFRMPISEGEQSICTRGKPYRISTGWSGGRQLHSYEWLQHTYGEDTLTLRLVCRDPFSESIPPLYNYCWSVAKANQMTDQLPIAVQKKDPLGCHRHVVAQKENSVRLTRTPTCTPLTCAYNQWHHTNRA